MNLAPAVLALTLLASPIPGLSAQVDTATESRLRTASRIRLELTSRERLEARFQALRPSYLVVQAIVRPTFHKSYFAERHVPLDSLSRIWIRVGTQSRNGAIVGGIVFGSIGLVMGAAFAEYSDCAIVVCMAAGAVGVGLAGHVAGGVFGALLPRWRVVWPPGAAAGRP